MGAGPGQAREVSRHPPAQTREVWAWAFYDFANSSFTTVVITAVYGSFFVDHIVTPSSPLHGLARYKNSLWSVTLILATLFALVASPWVGATLDAKGQKKLWLGVFTGICATATAALGFVNPGQVFWAMGLVALGSGAFMVTETLCASLLPDISSPKNMGLISGLGWGLGYLGGLCSLLVVRFMVTAPPTHHLYITQTQWAMWATSLFFVIFALPTFFVVRVRTHPSPPLPALPPVPRGGSGNGTALGQRIKQTLTGGALGSLRFRLFLCAFFLYMAGLDGVLKFVGIYAKQVVGLSLSELTTLFLFIQISACAGALGFGVLEKKWGPIGTVLVTLFWWMGAILGLYELQTLSNLTHTPQKNLFFVIALLAGAGVGSTQSASRTVVGLLAPPAHHGQAFGLWGFTSRCATILAMSFGFVADFFGYPWALLLLLCFFSLGAIVLLCIQRGARLTRPIQK